MLTEFAALKQVCVIKVTRHPCAVADLANPPAAGALLIYWAIVGAARNLSIPPDSLGLVLSPAGFTLLVGSDSYGPVSWRFLADDSWEQAERALDSLVSTEIGVTLLDSIYGAVEELLKRYR